MERIVDFKSEYNDTYKNVIEKMEEFQDSIIKNAYWQPFSGKWFSNSYITPEQRALKFQGTFV